MRRGVETGEVRPLSRHVFEKTEAEEAFRFMASGKHIGKVLIRIRADSDDAGSPAIPITLVASRQTFFHPNKSVIVTGGLGGFGLELARWLVDRGCTKMVLSSRTGIKTSYQRLTVDRLREAGATVVVSTADVSTRLGAERLVTEAMALGPVGGIFHLAMVLNDASVDKMTIPLFESVCAAKVNGCQNLDLVTKSSCHELDHFVCFSSVVSGRGNPGQINYGYANSVMERICERRKREGLPGLAIQWGAIGDVGVVADALGGNDAVIGGSKPQRMPSCFKVLDQLMQSNEAIASSIVRADAKATFGGAKNDLLGQILHILGVKDPSSVEPETTLVELGMDSLMAVEIRQGLERDYELVLTTEEIRNLKIADIKEFGDRAVKSSDKSTSGGEVDPNEELRDSITLSDTFFVRLSSEDSTGRPVFVFPPIEGSFKALRPLSRDSTRPHIGLNWTSDVDSSKTIEEVAAIYVQKLIDFYPEKTYDFMAYSFGTLVAIEVAGQMQARLGPSGVARVMLLDGSPEYLKAFAIDAEKRTGVAGQPMSAMERWARFAANVLKVESYESLVDKLSTNGDQDGHSLESQLVSYIQMRTGLVVTPSELIEASERLARKRDLTMAYERKVKVTCDVKLLRVQTQLKYVNVSNDYGLSTVSD